LTGRGAVAEVALGQVGISVGGLPAGAGQRSRAVAARAAPALTAAEGRPYPAGQRDTEICGWGRPILGQAHAMRDSTDNDARSAVGPRQAEVKMAGGSVPCTCGHDHAAYRHYRSAGECALCRCPDRRPNRGLRRVVASLRVGHAGYDRAPTTSASRPRRRCPSWGGDGPIGGTHGCRDLCRSARPFKRRTC